MFEAARVPTFRLISTGDRPELELAEGHKWHLFLSHIWGTGQDQCATIKRQLCLLLPGVSVFLDVDDLEDIGALEEYIEKTGLIMIFVSKGYFHRRLTLILTLTLTPTLTLTLTQTLTPTLTLTQP